MVRVDYDVRIGRTPESVFSYITRVETYAEWQRKGGIEKVTRVDDGPTRLGTRFSMQRRAQGGKLATIDCEVTGFEPGRRFAFHSIDSDGFAGDFVTTLQPAAGGTDLHWAVDMRPPNLLYRLLSPVIAREIRRSADADFPELKRTLEAKA
jgi:uncharacterized protein YndB with AHSA1/START domain